MSFDSQDVKDITKNNKDDDYENRRTDPRRSVLWPAILHVSNHQFNCQIRNFSLGGVRLKFNLPLKEGTVVKIEVPREKTTLRAEVAWQSEDLMGLRFLENSRAIQDVFGEQASIMGMTPRLDPLTVG